MYKSHPSLDFFFFFLSQTIYKQDKNRFKKVQSTWELSQDKSDRTEFI